MSKRESWRKILDSETHTWSTKSCDELVSELTEERLYRIESGSEHFQVSVQMLENTDEYVQVMVSVHDGSLWGLPFALERQLCLPSKTGADSLN